ncbi:transcription antiterminator LicT [Enterococcus faecalis]|uniref:BglG family transcription antiterminator LicT n=1 Tax=Enterococcus faecalis TaxID=1351 RepID=UPI000A19D971|nr:PRD domain-containing protein [Enterococcus faecalis]OSM25638.1 transcription antiterminator LicT [Enterococcus faecalis]OSM28837.1 transcription antiterminator LicT [Enterococcus faecalis]WPH48006.1 PRD domain-containing protein [Enterococcus faecalis]
MKIKKILNNNAVVVWRDGQEAVVISKGIAYNRKPGELIYENQVDQIFTMKSSNKMDIFQELMIDLPIEYVKVSKEIIEFAEETLNKKLNDSIYIQLTDHIKFAVERSKEGINVTNGLLWETKSLYSKEFSIGLEALNLILTRLGVLLSEDEAGFIALHIINAELNSEMPRIQEMTKITKEILFIIKYYFKLNFDENSISYNRLLTHLKFFSQRLVTKNPQEIKNDDELKIMVSQKYGKAYNCAVKIKDFINGNYHYLISDDELLYLTIHINRVIEN